MKARRLAPCALLALLVVPGFAFADAQKGEWFGQWSMNHDGHVGTLMITDIKADCGGPVWCDMAVRYTDSQGKTHSGKIDRIDDRLQHMAFSINFPGNTQKFDARIFSWDKKKLAGTTYWGGRTFGFYALKR